MAKPKSRRSKNSYSELPFSAEAGQTFRKRRLELGITIDEVASETKIHRNYIKAIEGSDYSSLPHSTQTTGFVRRYARLLGLDEKTAVSKYLLQRGPLPKGRAAGLRQRVKSPIIGTRLLGWLVFGGILVLVAGYLLWQLSILASPPRLSIESPRDNQPISEPRLEVRGKTSPGVEVHVDGQVIYVDDNGQFTATVILSPGINTVKIDAVNRKQQTTTLERSVYYQTE